jgi:hypothetical protein
VRPLLAFSLPFLTGALLHPEALSQERSGELLAGSELSVELPESPARRVLEAALESAEDGAFDVGTLASWPADLDDAAWSSAAPWLVWAELLTADSGAADVRGARGRASLALLAASQGRSADAWRHLAACADEPRVARAVLPHLFPGVPAGSDPHEPLPDGVLLRPVLPPPPRELLPGEIVPAEMTARGLRVGDATLDVHLELARDGVQVDVENVSGGPAELALLLPEPEHYRIRVDYLDWEQRETPGLPHRIALDADREEAVSSWGRFAPRLSRTPGAGETLDLEGVRRRGLVIETSPARRALAAGLAAALSRIFEVDARVRAPVLRSAPGTGFAEPIVLRLADGPEGLESLRTWIALAERTALGERGP